MEVFWEKRPLTGKFSQMFSKRPTEHTETRLLWKFREILPTGSRWNRALFNGPKKNKISALPPAAASARIAPKICQGQLQTIDSKFPKFHPNPFTSAWTSFKRATKCLQYSAKLQLLRRVMTVFGSFYTLLMLNSFIKKNGLRRSQWPTRGLRKICTCDFRHLTDRNMAR